jgi:hypothetical protein
LARRKPSKGVEQAVVAYDLTDGKELFSVARMSARASWSAKGGHVPRGRNVICSCAMPRTAACVLESRWKPGETLAGLASDDNQLYYVTRAKIGGENKSFLTALLPNGTRAVATPGPGLDGRTGGVGRAWSRCRIATRTRWSSTPRPAKS